MKPAHSHLQLEDIGVDVVRKDVKHIRISVHPPYGHVRVSTPRYLSDAALRQALLPRLVWMRRKQAEMAAREGTVEPTYEAGEMHCLSGRPYPLVVTERPGRADVVLAEGRIELRLPPGCDRARRAAVLECWYRRELAEAAQPLLAEWTAKLGVSPAEMRIRRMKTRWGSCNTKTGRIWLNLELAKREEACLEYVLIHELVHLLEPNHSSRFWALMDAHLPEWRQRRAALKQHC